MYFKQFYLGCLAHASYLIGSEGVAAVVDPQRDVDEYIADAEANGLRIRYVIETHLHADFVSGHRELAARTGAEIVFGEKAGASFSHRAVRDDDEITIGKVVLRVIETPGHTPESISILVVDTESSNQPQKVLTGDTLFVGDVGRPDLAGAKGYTPQMMAGMMYDTLHQKLLRLANETEIYPAHGAGSMCGRNMSQETSSTIGEQKKSNYALRQMSRDEFIRLMTTDMPAAPGYFSKDAEINRSGASPLATLPRPAAFSAQEVSGFLAKDYLVLDVRSAAEFGAGHIPGSINIGLGGQFAIWAGTLIPLTAPIIIVAESEAKVDEAVVRLARVGIESAKGYLKEGIQEWRNAGLKIATVPQITVGELNDLIQANQELQILDVRRPSEYESGHVPGATTEPLLTLKERAPVLDLEPSKLTAVICAGGYRSSIATSILRQNGFANLLNVTGGTGAWIDAGHEVEIPG
ncbi:MAG: MBL fold metallo-hydrolase [Pyrinomonadaceae bacterium]